MTIPRIALSDGNAIPQLGFGVWQISQTDIVAAATKALEVGYRHIDTAAIYKNEEGVGEAIRRSGIPRDEIFVTTKLWNNAQQPDAARAAIHESLHRLGLDYVDLYLIHWPVPMFDEYVGAWETLLEFREQGLARSVGVSNFNPDHLDRIISATGETPVVNQIEVHPTFARTDLIAYHDSLGIKTESWSPLGQGSALQRPEIIDIAAEVGRTPAQVTIRWHIERGLIVFPRSVTPARIQENFDVFDFSLTPDQMALLATLDEGNRTGGDPETFDYR